MSNLYFITHPEVTIDEKIDVRHWQLSEKGINRIAKLANYNFWEDVKIIYSSEEKKSLQVAEVLSTKLGLGTEKIKDLGEIDRSSTGYLPIKRYNSTILEFYNYPEKSVEGWETALSAQERISSCIENLDSDHDIAVISHGAVGSLLKSYFEDKPPSISNDPGKQGRFFIADISSRKLITEWLDY